MHDFDDAVVPSATGPDRDSVPLWMTLAVVVLILAILGVVGALVYSVFVTADVPLTLEQRDLIFYKDQVAKNPDSAGDRVALAQVYIDLGRYDEAVAEADQAITLQPAGLDGYLVKGTAYRLMGEYEKALAANDEILKVFPEHAVALAERSMVQEAMGDIPAAIESLEASIAAEPTASDVLVELGRLYEKQGEREKAIEQYKKALQFIPDYSPALAALARLGAG